MRWLYLLVIVLFVAAVVTFAVQNVEPVTMSFLQFSVQAPLALLAIISYVLGALTGGSLFGLLRATVRATKARWPATSP